MASVLIPQRQARTEKADPNSRFLPLAGQVFGAGVGGVYGGAGGAAAGRAAGEQAGGAGSELIYREKAHDQVIEQESAGSIDPQSESAMSRRMTKIDNDPYNQIAQANQALDRAPKEVQDAYRAPLQEAMELARKSREQSAASQRMAQGYSGGNAP